MNGSRILSILILLLSSSAFAHPDSGWGVHLGTDSGITAVIRDDPTTAVDINIGSDFEKESMTYLYSDYLTVNPDFSKNKNLSLYYGIGTQIWIFADHKHISNGTFGPRIPLGFSYKEKKSHLELFTEVSVSIQFVPVSDVVSGNARFGFRYYWDD